jgi:hypothetical protein
VEPAVENILLAYIKILFFGLFNDAVSSSDRTALSAGMINETRIRKNTDGI